MALQIPPVQPVFVNPVGPAAPTSSGGGSSSGILLTVSAPALQVPATAGGFVSDFSLAVGQAFMFNGSANVNAQTTFTIIGQANCTAVITGGGAYSFSALTQNVGSITIQGNYLGVNYQATVTISKQIPGGTGATGPPGATGPTGPTGPGGVAGLALILSRPSSSVLAYANGSVPSFAGINGQATVFSGGVDVTASSVLSAVASGLTGTINSALNTPVTGPMGFYQVTAMSATIGTLTITAQYLGTNLTQIYTVTQVPTGYQIVSSLPSSGLALFQGNVVFLTTDNKLYRYTGTTWTAVVQSSDITGTITTTQIAPGSITTPLLAANSVTAAQVAANTLTSNQIQAGSIVAASMGVTSLSSMTANLGAIMAGTISALSGQSLIDMNNGFIEFNNGAFMKVSGVGFGATSNYLEWYGPTQSPASNFAACTDALGIWWLKTDGTSAFKGTITSPSNVHTYVSNTTQTGLIEVAPITGNCLMEAWGAGASGNARNNAPGAGGGGGGYCSRSQSVMKGEQFTFKLAGFSAASTYISVPINGVSGQSSTINAVLASGTVAMVANGGLLGTAAGVAGAGGTATGGTTNATGSAGSGINGGNGADPYGFGIGGVGDGTPGGLGSGGAGDIFGSQSGTGGYGQVRFTYS